MNNGKNTAYWVEEILKYNQQEETKTRKIQNLLQKDPTISELYQQT